MLLHATVDGPLGPVEIAYRRSGAGDPVVLIHGLGASSTAWHYQARELALTHSVYAIDLPGSGGSPMQRPASGEAAADAVAAFIEQVVGAPAAVVGHSMGGAVALLTALRHPPAVTSLALVSAAGLGRDLPLLLRLLCLPAAGALASLAAPVLLRLLEREPRLRRRVSGGGDGEVLSPVLAEAFERYRRPAAIRQFVAALRAGADFRGQRARYLLRDRLAALEIPLLLVWGRDDRVLPLAHGLEAARHAGARGRLVVLDCGHSPMLEAAPALTRLLVDFLGSKPKVPAVA